MTEEIQNDYGHCVECSRSGAIRTLTLFGRKVGFDRFNGDYTDMWAENDTGWHCPNHAHIAMDMSREEFEELRDNHQIQR